MPRSSFSKKGVFHSELVKAGPIVVKITSDVFESKFKKGTYVCSFECDGEPHDYTCENQDCEDALKGLKGKTICLEASGSREDAAIHVSAASGGRDEEHPRRETRQPAWEERAPRDERREPARDETPHKTPVFGATVGMAINNAVKLIGESEGITMDYLKSSDFSRDVTIIASNLLRVAAWLDAGNIAKPEGARQPERQPEPPKQQAQVDDDLNADGPEIPF